MHLRLGNAPGAALLFLIGAAVGSVVTTAWLTTANPHLGKQTKSASDQPSTPTVPTDILSDVRALLGPPWSDVWPALAFPARTGQELGSVTRKYDEFEQRTTFSISIDLRVPGTQNWSYRLQLQVAESGEVNALTKPPPEIPVTLLNVSSGMREGWDLIILADGERIRPRSDQSEMRDYDFWLDTKDLLKLVAASQLKCRCGHVEVLVPGSAHQSLRDFAAILKP